MAGLFDKFIAGINADGVAKVSHFDCQIATIPTILSTRFSGYDRLLALRCEATELPGRQLITQDSRIYGPTYKTPYQSAYQEITLTFLETQDMFVRDFFESWINSIFNADTNLLNFPDTYRTTVVLNQYDTTGAPTEGGTNLVAITGLHRIMSWALLYAFPTAVNQLPVAWTDDGFHRVAVTLSYEYYQLFKTARPQNTAPPTSRGVDLPTRISDDLQNRINKTSSI